MKIKIQNKTYSLEWNVRAILTLRKLGTSEDPLENALNTLFAVLPRGSFESVDHMAENINPDELEDLIVKVGEFTESQTQTKKKTEKGTE